VSLTSAIPAAGEFSSVFLVKTTAHLVKKVFGGERFSRGSGHHVKLHTQLTVSLFPGQTDSPSCVGVLLKMN